MILSRNGHHPSIHPDAWIAPDATICGNVTIEKGSRVLYGARVIAEAGHITIGPSTIVMENAVVRSTATHNTQLGANCLVGPNSHLVGCHLEEQVFVATGCAIFHGATIGAQSEIRIHAVVHVKSRLPQQTTVPIAWVAVGDPARLFPPTKHDDIWAVQEPLNFPLEAYGLDRADADMVAITQQYSQLFNHETATEG